MWKLEEQGEKEEDRSVMSLEWSQPPPARLRAQLSGQSILALPLVPFHLWDLESPSWGWGEALGHLRFSRTLKRTDIRDSYPVTPSASQCPPWQLTPTASDLAALTPILGHPFPALPPQEEKSPEL